MAQYASEQKLLFQKKVHRTCVTFIYFFLSVTVTEIIIAEFLCYALCPNVFILNSAVLLPQFKDFFLLFIIYGTGRNTTNIPVDKRLDVYSEC
jgi:hypothetical protein